MNNIKAAIFDMDGTLIDSMWVWKELDYKYLKKIGKTMPKDFKKQVEHLSFKNTAKYFKDQFQINETVEQIMNDWNNMAKDDYEEKVTLKDGVIEYLEHLKNSGIKIGLATSNCSLLINTVLGKYNLLKYFDSITITDEVSKGKNFPDVYLLSAKKLDVDPNNCVVFEDILPAIQGAKSAGMKVIAVADSHAKLNEKQIIKYADKYISSFKELL